MVLVKIIFFVESQEFGIISAKQKEKCMKKNIQKKQNFTRKRRPIDFASLQRFRIFCVSISPAIYSV